METRREARRQALQILYQLDVAYGYGAEDIASALERWRRFSEERPSASVVAYVSEVTHGVAERLAELDELIREYARGWALERMAVVDRSIVRLALFEMAHRDDIPASVAINEAVELAKRFGDSRSAAFINGILAQVKRDREGAESTEPSESAQRLEAPSRLHGNTAQAAVPSAALPKRRRNRMAKPGIGAQLIVFGGRTGEDLGGVLRDLAEIGYDAAEVGANLMDADRAALHDTIAAAGIRICGIHTGFGSIPDEAWQDKAIAFVQDINAERIICSGVADNESLSGYVDTADTFNAFGAKCAAAGVEFCYHNHAWEFRTFDGVKGIHKLCELTDPAAVKLNIDVYWVTVGGEDPAEFIERYGDRVGYYHFKDGPYTASGSVAEGPYSFVELGTGTVDLAGALAAALKHDPSWIVYEQDSSEIEPTEAARISFEHLKSLGL